MIDWDWTVGILIQFVVFFLWAYNIYEGVITLNWVFAGSAGLYCFWFIFAPWCISEYLAFLKEPFRQHSSIYSAIRHERFMKKHGVTP